ncbi:MAG: pyridoxal phosphate-dependent aminotransferase [Bacteroidetes bacterium]|nr:pyridoxal phosphate-dependent aminotransferase [Bacteroidota bacterium]MBV6460869.1 Aspartate aminotransferase [Flavobacteriales bacterium]WKZ75867.1 MAG: pyridoxal phosphate-dependent aminotransferase [Vicingaceae bacterium]MCL4816586.1 pyridoxal phosphate-dependent aminotransferase [Flavobacteriales bacterium]NOG95631.1 pyridoxal phosphate-dependent aminotransferase [Bacteroidota bacterium]
MPLLSNRGAEMPESPIRKLVPYAEAAKKRGVKVYHLNIGQPDIKTPEVALEAIRNNKLEVLEYSHSAGIESYRKGLAEYYNSFQLNIEYTNIIVTTGGSEALLFAFFTCLNPGDEVIIPEPFYANYNGFATTAGVKIKPITSYIDTGFSLPKIEEFEKLITSKTKAILICNPGNPTGYLYSESELESLKEIVKKHRLFLFSDEVYREFCYDGKKHISVLQLEGIDANAIVVDSISKRYSMCGARIGAFISRNKEVMQTALKYAQARLSPPTLGQIAAEAALTTPQTYFDEVISEYDERRNVLVNGLNKIEGVVCPMPGGAFYAVAELPIDNADNFCKWMLEYFEYKKQTVMLAPATGFYATKGVGNNQVRMAYVLKKEDLKNALICLEEALKVYPNRVEINKKMEAL